MRILILDDEEIRHQTFARKFMGNDTTHVRNSQECIDALLGSKFDMVSLDHDLGEVDTTSTYPKEITGTDVAQWMAVQLPQEKRPRAVHIHSHNPVGARRMLGILRDAGFSVVLKPFNPNLD